MFPTQMEIYLSSQLNFHVKAKKAEHILAYHYYINSILNIENKLNCISMRPGQHMTKQLEIFISTCLVPKELDPSTKKINCIVIRLPSCSRRNIYTSLTG